MKNPLNLLSRLFRKNPNNAVISSLFSKMSQPLFVHPELGEMVMRSYLHAVANPLMITNDKDYTGTGFVTRHDDFAVIDISGALTAREESVPCAASPASYEVIKQDMAELLADDSIKTIIGRFDSPGGMAAQNMDLSDFIYSSRGQGTRLIAMVDDMAYSAAFGIATAFDEIHLTRTGGVGSVGVVRYHVDQSEANAKAGIKVEYIYAGDKKILGNPHAELSEEGRKEYQTEVNRLYNIFTATIARNLGLSVEQVKDTQAGTYHGEEALAVGFAHKLGTFDELLTSLLKESVDRKSAIAASDTGVSIVMDESEKPTIEQSIIDAEANLENDEQGIDPVDLNLEGSEDLPDNDGTEENSELEENTPESNLEEEPAKDDVGTTSQERDELDAEKLKAEQLIERNAEIKALCEAANAPNLANVFIRTDMSIDLVREELLSLTSTSESNGIVNSTSVALTNEDDKSISQSWADAFEKV